MASGPASFSLRVDAPPGIRAHTVQAGDFILCRSLTSKGSTTALGQFIEAGERVRYGDTDWARWNHAALVAADDGTIIEATEDGVRTAPLSKYDLADYIVVRPFSVSHVQRHLAVRFAYAHVGASYGFLNFVGLGAQSLFGLNLAVHMDTQFICSGLVARATEKYIDSYPRSPESMMPADLAHYWGAQSGEKPLKPSWWSRALVRLAAVLSAVL